MFGIAGSHRAGKTTVLNNIREIGILPTIETSVSKIMAQEGYNTVGDLSLTERIKMQRRMLELYCDILDKSPRPYITDRTPIDMAAYALGEITMRNSNAQIGAEYSAYVNDCIDVTSKYFSRIFVLRPLSTYETAVGKPPENTAYQALIQNLIEGMMNKTRVHGTVINTEDHGIRMANILRIVGEDMKELSELKKSHKMQ